MRSLGGGGGRLKPWLEPQKRVEEASVRRAEPKEENHSLLDEDHRDSEG